MACLLSLHASFARAVPLSQVALQELAEKPVSWPFAFYNDNRQHDPDMNRYRFAAELDNLSLRYRIQGHAVASRAMQQWRQALQSLSDSKRVPANLDPAWLMAHPRHDRDITHAITIGYCQPATTVTRWGVEGIQQQAWHDGMTTRDITADWSLPEGFSGNWAWLITPTGRVERFGYSSWNSDPLPVPAGSRIVPELTLDAVAARWMNHALPQWLATRRPGHDCRQWTYDPDTVSDSSRMSSLTTNDNSR
nr:capsule biosynthesis GfcC family protein [Kushneria sinocarnis]